jgi:hypothetical protein
MMPRNESLHALFKREGEGTRREEEGEREEGGGIEVVEGREEEGEREEEGGRKEGERRGDEVGRACDRLCSCSCCCFFHSAPAFITNNLRIGFTF